ncbi:SulP family inorganic anion transporter [Nocardia sputi]|uniref:SulP family inorganic anion transporter n=1 Tax=Nocardia sputi TaxID=2943705 RepID=UPI001CBF09E6|nr:SulP family inorganic anion transporter [Nocardia sputi]
MLELPGLGQFKGYQRPWLRADLLAGVTVTAYLVPQVMAYATTAGLPPVAGLWAAATATAWRRTPNWLPSARPTSRPGCCTDSR